MMHLHGFGLSGRYLMPTAERLAGEFHTLVPDLPGFGRSGRALQPLDVPDLAAAAADFMDDRKLKVATLVGNSMGPGHLRVRQPASGPDRPRDPRLAGRRPAQPTAAACPHPAGPRRVREPTRLMSVAVPDYLRFGVPSTLRLFRALTQFPALERLLQLEVPTLVVVGDRDPLMPTPARIREIANQYDALAALVVIEGAAHAINFSHPGELANVIRLFMADKPIKDDASSPGRARAYEFHRGARLRSPRRVGPAAFPQWRRVFRRSMKTPADPASTASSPRRHPSARCGTPRRSRPGEEQDRGPQSSQDGGAELGAEHQGDGEDEKGREPADENGAVVADGREEQSEQPLALAQGAAECVGMMWVSQ